MSALTKVQRQEVTDVTVLKAFEDHGDTLNIYRLERVLDISPAELKRALARLSQRYLVTTAGTRNAMDSIVTDRQTQLYAAVSAVRITEDGQAYLRILELADGRLAGVDFRTALGWFS